MKIKTITRYKEQELDDAVNKFDSENKVKFTQTHVSSVNGLLIYTAIIFYE